MIVVLGMHRSGTSLVAGALHRMGVPMGTRFRAPDSSNPHGYWEDLDWRDLNKAILNGAGGTWYDPPPLHKIEKQVARYAMRISELCTREGEWGFKDPRTSLSIHYLHTYFPNAKYIYTTRTIAGMLSSLTKRASQRGYYESPDHWLNLINLYDLRLNNFLLTYRPLHVHRVRFEDAIHDPKTTMFNLASFVDVSDVPPITAAIKSVTR